ncbi:MAG: hypothetical protein WC485_00425 [Opitutaceae bacterium]
MKGYKGFDNNLRCNEFQYAVGGTYEHDGNVILCASGFHFCENPLDVFAYYRPADSRYAEVETDGVSDQTHSDSKRVCRQLKISAEIDLRGIIAAGIKFILDKVDFSETKESATGDQAGAQATGDRAGAQATGVFAVATAVGDYGTATIVGNELGAEGCAAALGIGGKAKGAVGCWLTLAEWKLDGDKWSRVDVRTKRIDGKRIKADTWYSLVDEKFVAV